METNYGFGGLASGNDLRQVQETLAKQKAMHDAGLETKPQSAVDKARFSLMNHTGELHEYLTQLEQRLSPVLQGENVNGLAGNAEGDRPRPPISPLTAQLESIDGSLVALLHRLRSINDRLDV